ncbi:MAG: hypothetical protein IPM64_01170 [Phycisphaerales bacterium]|nr:hypothetical protein [Phycisphaerales bacterium]
MSIQRHWCAATAMAVLLNTALCASPAFADVFPEVEPNDRRAVPQELTLECGDGVTGTSTGLDSFMNPGPTTVDHFLFNTPAASGQILRFRVSIPSANFLSLHGRTPASATADVTLQSSLPNPGGGRYVAWYGLGFDGLDRMNVRLGGSESTTEPYVATLECSPVTPVLFPVILPEGLIRILAPSAGGSVVLFDSQLQSLPGMTGSSLNLSLSGGEYLLGLSTSQIASPGSNTVRTVFPGMAVAPSSASNTTRQARFQYGPALSLETAVSVWLGEAPAIGWVRFYVAGGGPGACCIGAGCIGDMTPESCAAAGGSFLGGTVPCVLEYCPRACCYTDGDCRDIGEPACLHSGGQPAALGTPCATANCPALPGSGCINPFVVTLPAQLPSSDARSSCGMSRSLVCGADTDDVMYQLIVTEPVCLRVSAAAPAATILAVSSSCPPCMALASDVIDPLILAPGVHWLSVRPAPCGEFTLQIDPCAPRACCFIDGTCQYILPPQCAQLQGATQAVGTDCSPGPCPPAQTCCLADLNCVRITPAACSSAGGRVYPGQPECTAGLCSELRACCRPDATCVELSVGDCLRAYGSVQPPDVPCADQCAAVCLKGDINCDGAVNNFDIDPYIVALINCCDPFPPATWAGTVECWQIRDCNGDINRDGTSNSFDIDPFVSCMVTHPAPGDPCPAP